MHSASQECASWCVRIYLSDLLLARSLAPPACAFATPIVPASQGLVLVATAHRRTLKPIPPYANLIHPLPLAPTMRSNFVTAIGDVMLYNKRYTLGVWAVLALMMTSAIVGASTDSKFSWRGYSWQAANCIFTSAYALYLRSVMDRVSEHTTNKQRMDEFSMVYYNNLLSLVPIFGLMLAFNEHATLLSQPALYNPWFLLVASMGGIIGFAISFSSLWFLSQTTATFYSLVGALNKIPVAVLGIVAFQESTNPKNLASIIIGLAAGVLFVRVKQR